MEREGDSWACFLVTYPLPDGSWKGYFSFRPGHSEVSADEARTTDIFVEDDEGEILRKARGLGRPLLRGLLDSALHAGIRSSEDDRHLRGRFRSLLNSSAQKAAPTWDASDTGVGLEAEDLRSLYDSYCLDQVSHLICLVDPDVFAETVDRILSAERIDFLSKDRVQFAMIVVDHLRSLLPLPDFSTWVEDYRGHPDAYRLYAHVLHREGRLP